MYSQHQGESIKIKPSQSSLITVETINIKINYSLKISSGIIIIIRNTSIAKY